jgi:hypothetical protein
MNLTQSNGQDLEAFYSKFLILYKKAREGSREPVLAEDLFKYQIFLAKLLSKICLDIIRMDTLLERLSDLITMAQRLYQIDK